MHRVQLVFLGCAGFATGTAVAFTALTVAAFATGTVATLTARAAFAAGSALTLYVAFGLGLKGTH